MMGLKSLFFASSLMLVLVTCSAQTVTDAVTDAATDLPTDAGMTTVLVPDTNPTEASNTTASKAPTTAAPATDPPATDAPATKAPATEPPATKKPTDSPVVGTTEKAPDTGSNKGFSAGSFFGGIILAVAVLGIGFCGFKFYQSRQDKNYQTL